jgi:hypothetical protein
VTLGDRVLDWLLRRLGTQKPVEADLVLVRAHEALAGTPSTFSHKGDLWHFAAVRGELTLRQALLRGGRLVAAVPDGFRLPLDLTERAYLRRPITVEAQDIVAGLAGTFCVRIQDPVLADAIEKNPARLARHSAAWTLSGKVVTEAEVKQVVVAAELGFDRKIERLQPSALLARWIVAGPPMPSSPELLDEILRVAHGREGEWLAWSIRDGQLEQLLAAGALAGSARGRGAAPAVPRVDDDRAWDALRALVEGAVREAWKETYSPVSPRKATIPPPAAPAVVVLSGKVGLDIVEALQDQPRGLKALETIAAKGVITATQLGPFVEKKPIFVRGLVSDVQNTLQRKRLPVPFSAEEQDDEMVYRWKIRS